MTNKRSVLEVVIDATGAKQGADAAVDAYRRMERATSNYGANASKIFQSTSTTLIRSMTSAKVIVINVFKAISTAISTSFRAIKGVTGFMSELKLGVTALFGALTGGAIAKGISSLVTAGLRMQKFRTTLTVVTGTAAAANKELDWLMRTADRVGISFEQSAEPFARFAAASTEIFDKEQIRDIFSAFSEASAALHLNQQEINGVFLALQQMASKGKVSMEELRLQLAERIPGAMQLAADSMDMSVATLEEQIRKRMISAEDFLGKFAKAIHDKFGSAAKKAAATALGAFADLRNSVFQAKVDIAEAGLLKALGDGATRLAMFLRSNREITKELGNELSKMVTAVVDFTTNLTKEDVRQFFTSVKEFASSTVAFFVGISNTAFFKWLAGPTKSEKLDQEIDTISKRIENTKRALAQGPINTDTYFEKLLRSKLDDYETALKTLKSKTAEVDASLPSVTTESVSAQRNAGFETSGKSDAAYKEQLGVIMDRTKEILSDNFETNELIKRRKELLTRSSELMKEIQGKSSKNLSMKERVASARNYRDVMLSLKQVNEDLNSSTSKSVSLATKYGDEYEKAAAKLLALQEVQKNGVISSKDFEAAQQRILDKLDLQIAKKLKIQEIDAQEVGVREFDMYKDPSIDNGTFPEAESASGFIDALGGTIQNEDKYASERSELEDHFQKKKELVVGSAQQIADQLVAIDAQSAAAMKKLHDSQNKNRLAGASQMFGSLSGLMNSHNKTAFRVGKAAAIANAGIATYESATKAYSAMVGIPIVGPVLAVAAAGAAIAAGFANVQSIMSTQMPAAHGGLDYVPKESTYLLDKGERVLSPRQNKDLTGFLNSGGGGGGESGDSGVTIINLFDREKLQEVIAEEASNNRTPLVNEIQSESRDERMSNGYIS